MHVDLTDPIFTNEDAARAHFEALRWPNGPVCPHCGSIDSATQLQGKSTRPGVYKCQPTSAARPAIGRAKGRPKRQSSRWSSVTAAFAPITSARSRPRR
jgi:hypothetical protein